MPLSAYYRRLLDSRLIRLFGLGFIIFGLGKILQISFFILAARRLSQADFGLFSLVISVSQISAVCLAIGIPNAGMRLVSTFEGRKHWPLLKGYIKFAFLWCAALALIIAALVLSSRAFLTQNKHITFATLLALTLPAVLWGISRAGIMRGFNSMVGALVPREIVVPVITMALILISGSDNVLTVGLFYVGALCAAEAGGLLALRRRIPKVLSSTTPEFAIRDWLSVSLPIQASSIARIILQRSDLIFVGAFAGLKEVAIYAIAQRLAQAVQIVSRVSNNAISPILARSYHSEDPQKVLKVIRSAMIITATCCIAIAAVLILAAPYVINIFGDNYAGAVPILIILALGQLTNAIFSPILQALNMTDLERVQLSIVAITAVAALIFLPIAASQYGALGAAIVTALSLLFLNLASYVIGYPKLKQRIAQKMKSGDV